MRQDMRQFLKTFCFLFCLSISGTLTQAQERRMQHGVCGAAPELDAEAFSRPMTFRDATSKGNSNVSVWTAAVGLITKDTPQEFLKYVQENGGVDQVVLHSPGGNLSAGMELGRLFREFGATTHVGETVRWDVESNYPCRTWVDTVENGECSSACAWAFMGGVTRFLPSPYYPTNKPSRLGFHQFYDPTDPASAFMSPDQIKKLRDESISVAQLVTGQTVLYAIEMGVSADAIALATNTGSSTINYPSPEVLAEFKITTPQGFGKWFLEPYKGGMVAAAKPDLPTSMLVQTTSFCRKLGDPKLLMTIKGFSSYYANKKELPISGAELEIDGQEKYIPNSYLSGRVDDGLLYLTIDLPQELAKAFVNAHSIDFQLDTPRSFGHFRETSSLDELARKSIALSWRNCF